MRGKLLFALGAAALVAAALVVGPSVQEQPVVAAAPVAPASAARPFVRSLEGTQTDGGALVGPGETLVANEDLVELFDYYLSALGEKNLEQVRAEIERELDRRLRPPASDSAKRLLARYLDYKHALVALEADKRLVGGDVTAIRKRLVAMRQLRARYFSAEESGAMFGREDAEQADALARLEVRQDTRLTPEQKGERLAALDAALPPEVRAAREEPLKLAHLQESVDRLRAGGANDDEVFRMRAAALNPEAAARLAALDQEEAQWRGRIAAYLNARRGVQEGPALDALRNRLFTLDEQRRLPAYEEGLR
ncbi:lipase chaperone [Massilia sp. Dwa41.01b]|uniref:lipase secretion chaperone n=1 Tax=unclassified Massilia TaxID=2609279 RepID=UPI0015FFC3D1|nr:MULTISPECIES: lipase secretion chaperone [unclassified Massilia]QNA88246.1 lipase chaperone [Massilia sp. Dwa41.01b]QNA99145.1 lipase chaperone [Massilia sp. Se16.2.3]